MSGRRGGFVRRALAGALTCGLAVGIVAVLEPSPLQAAPCTAPPAFLDAVPDHDPKGASNVVRFVIGPDRPGLTFRFQVDTGRGWSTVRAGVRTLTLEPGEYVASVVVTNASGCSATATDRYAANAVTTYAPTLFFHPNEKFFPGSAEEFLSRSQLVHWRPEKCGGKEYYAAGLQAREIGGVKQDPLVVGTLSGRSGRIYIAPKKDLVVRRGAGRCVTIDGEVRSDGNPAEPYVRRKLAAPVDLHPYRSGFYLNLLNRPKWREGDLRTARIYYTYEYQGYVAYWIFYPYNRFERAGFVEIHEGDWEHIVVRLGEDNVPTHAAFYQHNCGPQQLLRWEDTPRMAYKSTHPAVFPALGGHASYSRDPFRRFSEDAANCSVRGIVVNDRVKVGGKVWAPWSSGQLRLATDQQWYGFGGSWGDRSSESSQVANTYGPPAPGPYNVDVPDGWGTGRPPRDLADVTAPSFTGATITQRSLSGQTVDFTLAVTDDSGDPVQMRVKISGGEWRSWVPFASSGSVLLADRRGSMSVAFQVMDSSGNISEPRESNAITRWNATSIGLVQIDNNGTVRTCGGSPETACTDVVKRFRISVGGEVLPETMTQVRAWRLVNGAWVESSQSPFRRMATNRSTSFSVTENVLSGVWRFQALVPRDDARLTHFAVSAYQYLFVDIDAPTITGASLGHGDASSQYASFALAAADNSGAVTQMRLSVNGNWRDWVPYVASGTIVLPDSYGAFAIAFQVADARGNVSGVASAGTVTRLATVSPTLVQVDNSGNIRSCGAEDRPCAPTVKKFRITVSSPITPQADILVKAWRLVNSQWVETSASPYRRLTMASVTSFEVTENLLAGKWRFQVQIPVTATTSFAASGYQFLTIT